MTAEPPQDWGNRLLEGADSTRTQEKGPMTPKESEPNFPVTVQESLVEVWVDSGLPRNQGH